MELQEEYWEQWYSAIDKRYSVRKYDGNTIDDRSMSILMERASMLSTLYDDVRIAVAEIKTEKAFGGLMSALGGIKDVQGVAAFIGKTNSPQSYKHLGFAGEKFILECTVQGINTCWIGGTYNKRYFDEHFEMADNEKIFAVTPLGYSDDVPSTSHNERLPLDKISDVFEHNALPQGIKEAIEKARLAPSSMNRQPWMFQVTDQSIVIKKRKGALFGAKMLDIDLGIASAHIDIAMHRFGLDGSLEFHDNEIIYCIH